MGNFEKLVVMTVLFLSMLVLAVSFRSGKDEVDAGEGPIGKGVLPVDAGRAEGLLDSSVVPKRATERKPEAVKPRPTSAPKAPQPVLPGTILMASEGLRQPTLAGADFMLYTPTEGDRWRTLAERFYADPSRALLLQNNNEELADSEPIPGQTIVVPLFDTTQPQVGRESSRPVRTELLSSKDRILPAGSNSQAGQQAPAPNSGQPVAAAPKRTAPKTYTIKSGDTLSEISQAVYGKSARWKEIFEANRDKLTSADVLVVGVELVIP